MVAALIPHDTLCMVLATPQYGPTKVTLLATFMSFMRQSGIAKMPIPLSL
jgi:hypothetical protein